MIDEFNPYHEWLGLAPHLEQPNYYELLGIREGETDAAAISGGAVAAMSRVRRIKPGPRGTQLVRLFDEILAAKKCLSDPVKRVAYEQGLRGFPAPAAGRRPAPRPRLVATPVATREDPVPTVPMAAPAGVLSGPLGSVNALPAGLVQPVAASLNQEQLFPFAWPTRSPSVGGRPRFASVVARKRSRMVRGLALPVSIASVLAVAAVGILLAALISSSGAAAPQASKAAVQATR